MTSSSVEVPHEPRQPRFPPKAIRFAWLILLAIVNLVAFFTRSVILVVSVGVLMVVGLLILRPYVRLRRLPIGYVVYAIDVLLWLSLR